ncbi:MAG: branched-chain amino acid ABC transporter permease, partial [Microvirga sp.]
MEIFVQQLINGLTLGSIYGLIAIGYTMVFGIIGMVNFAHGDVFMLSAFISLIFFLILTTWLGISSVAVALLIVLVIAMVLTSLWGWAIERIAYRPLRGSFRLAPLISAIGVSIFLSNFVQVAQGARNKPTPPMVQDVIVLFQGESGYNVALSYKQVVIMVSTALLLAVFWYLVQKTSLGR